MSRRWWWVGAVWLGLVNGLLAAHVVEVRVAEGTSFALALTPDGERLVIDLQGRLWSLPVEGGEALALTDGLGDDRLPDVSPDGSRIVFQSFRRGSWDIWALGLDGSQPEPLTGGPEDDREPVWSPEGRRIAFSSDRSGSYDIWVLDADSGELTQLTRRPANDDMPAWSPDGSRVAFVSEGGDNGTELRVIPLDGGEDQRIATFHGRAVGPSWSPDGRQIAIGLIEDRLRSELLLVKVEDGEKRPLKAGEDVFAFRPSWAARGELYYTADGKIRRLTLQEDRVEDIPFRVTFRLDRPDTVRRRPPLAEPGARLPVRGIVRPVVSPDGTRVAFTALGDIWILSLNDGALVALTRDEYLDSDPSWSPDGRAVVFASDREGTMDLWLKEIGSSPGSGERRLTAGPGAEIAPACSPDGEWIAYLDEQGGVFVLPARGGVQPRLVARVGGSIGLPSWSPAGRHLALAALRPASTRFREGANRILVLDVDSGAERVLPVPEKSFGSRDGDGPVWSPDGRKMAFALDGALWVLPVEPSGDPSGPLQKVVDEAVDFPSWFPDARKLLYLASDELQQVDTTTGQVRRIALPLSYEIAASEGQLVVRGARLIDGTGAPPRDDVDIFIEADRIRRIAPSGGKIGEAVRVIDATGKTVVPGLIDSHTHLSLPAFGSRHGRIWLAYGVTSIRVPGSLLYRTLEEREAIASGRRIGPRVFMAGFTLDGDRVYYEGYVAVDGEEELEKELDRTFRLGLDMVKTYVRLPDALQKKVVREAHREGLPVSSHELYPAVAFGVDGVEHIQGTSRRGASPKVTELWRSYEDVIELIARSRVYFTPTMGIYGGAVWLASREPALLEEERLRALYPPWALGRFPWRATNEAEHHRLIEPVLKTVGAIAERGGKVLAGTDSPLVPYGLGLLMEVELLSEAGLGPLEAIRCATQRAAEALGAEQDLGTVEPGKRADLVILGADPSENIRNLRKTEQVILGGRALAVRKLLRASQ